MERNAEEERDGRGREEREGMVGGGGGGSRRERKERGREKVTTLKEQYS